MTVHCSIYVIISNFEYFNHEFMLLSRIHRDILKSHKLRTCFFK